MAGDFLTTLLLANRAAKGGKGLIGKAKSIGHNLENYQKRQELAALKKQNEINKIQKQKAAALKKQEAIKLKEQSAKAAAEAKQAKIAENNKIKANQEAGKQFLKGYAGELKKQGNLNPKKGQFNPYSNPGKGVPGQAGYVPPALKPFVPDKETKSVVKDAAKDFARTEKAKQAKINGLVSGVRNDLAKAQKQKAQQLAATQKQNAANFSKGLKTGDISVGPKPMTNKPITNTNLPKVNAPKQAPKSNPVAVTGPSTADKLAKMGFGPGE